MRAKILSASAGSGKTYQLAYKYVRDVIENPTTYRNILAVTFTNKATEEMKSRIIKEIHLLAAGERSNYIVNLCNELSLDERSVRQRAREVRSAILHDYSHFSVLTIDTFFQRIMRAFIKELGIDINYAIELDSDNLLIRSTDALVEDVATNRELQDWLTDFLHESLDKGNSWNIRQGIIKLGKEIFNECNKDSVGNATSKKDIKRIANEIKARSTAAEKEVAEVVKQALNLMSQYGVTHDDFSGRFTKYLEPIAEDPRHFYATIKDRADSMDKWFKKDGGRAAAQAIAGELRGYLAEIVELQLKHSKLWNTASMINENLRSFALLTDLYDKVLQMCEQENLMLLSETKYLLSKFIADNDAPFIYEKVGSRFDRFMIDEFQDTSLQEWHNFLPLLHNAMSQSEDTSVLLVGDVKQSIYRWRGGDWKILGNMATTNLGVDNTTIVNLDKNWRSLPLIVRFNNETIERVVNLDNGILNNELATATANKQISKDLATELQDMLSKAYANHAQEPCRKAEYDGYVNITVHDGPPPIIERIKTLLDKGFRPKDIMILIRTKKEGSEIARTLLDFKRINDDPRYDFDVMTQEALIIGLAPIVKFIISLFKLAINPDDSIALTIYRRYGSKELSFGDPLSDDELQFLQSIRLLSPEAAFERIVMQYNLAERVEESAYIQALHEHIVRFCIDKVADIALFLKWWDESGSTKSMSVEQSERTIEIITVHKAKGLEKPVIIIPKCNWELNPLTAKGSISSYVWSKAEGDEHIAQIGRMPINVKQQILDTFFAPDFFREKVYSHIDNINLLYVALTRAAESLHIFITDPSNDKALNNTVGKLLLSTITGAERKQDDDGHDIYEFGEFVGPCARREAASNIKHHILGAYNTREADMRLRLPSQRYFEDDERVELSPRNFGILMHRAFADAKRVEDIYEGVDKMVRDAVISTAEGERLRLEIGKALANPTIAEWFNEEWTEVRNENDIIVPNGQTSRRPDRVMVKGRKAVVVDYKFGEEEREKYATQLRDYMSLLSQIGYSTISGYIWYVRLGKVVKVTNN